MRLLLLSFIHLVDSACVSRTVKAVVIQDLISDSRFCAHSSVLCVFVRSVAQSCPTLCDPVDCSPPGSSVHGILQARTLE